MGTLSRILKPISQAATAFFRHDVAIKRGSQGVEIVLEPRLPDADRQRHLKDEARRKARAEVGLMLTQLDALLAEFPGSRATLKQLVFVEHALQKKGLKALHKLPLPVLQKALEQLESLVTNWSPAGLANLRSKMAVAIIEREQQAPPSPEQGAAGAAPAEAVDSLPMEAVLRQPQVEEVSDDAALAAAYASLGSMAPIGQFDLPAELGSTPARSEASVPPPAENIQIRKLESTASI